MKKQIMGIGIIGIFLLAGITTAFERSENITTKETNFSSFEEEDRYYDVYIFVLKYLQLSSFFAVSIPL